MVNAVVYDPNTGTILWSVQASEAALKKSGRPYFIVDAHGPEYDATHRIAVEKTPLAMVAKS